MTIANGNSDVNMSLLERKQLQWAKERAEKEEWYPFGRPGAGAPLRQSVRRAHNTSAPNPKWSSADNLLSNRNESDTNMQSSSNSPSSGPHHNGFPTTPIPQTPQPQFYQLAAPPGSAPPQIISVPQNMPSSPYVQGELTYITQNGVHIQQPTSSMVPAPPATPFGYVRLVGPFPPGLTPSASQAPTYTAIAVPEGYNGNHFVTSTPTNQVPYAYPSNQHPRSLSYTEQWANQLPLWHDHSDTVNNSRPIPVQSKTAVVTPLLPPPSSRVTGSTHLPQSLDSPTHVPRSLDGSSFMLRPNDLPVPSRDEFPQLPTIDSLSSITALSSVQRRRHVTENDDEWEDRQAKLLEQKLSFDEQIAEKRRLVRLENEKERREANRIEIDRKALERRHQLEDEAELNKWKEMRDEEEKREQAVVSAWEKAKQEAQLLRKAKIMQHTWEANNTEQGTVPNGATNGLTPEMEKAREEAKALKRRAEMERELIANQMPKVKSPDNSNENCTKPKTPEKPQKIHSPVKAPLDDRPIRPQINDPLQSWNKIPVSGDDDEEEPPQLTRKIPVRQSMRRSRSSGVAAARNDRRADSLERLGQNEEEDTPKTSKAPPKPPVRPPRPSSASRKERVPSANTVTSNGTYTVDDGNGRDVKMVPTPPKSQSVKPLRRFGVSPVRTNKSPKTEEKPKLLHRRPSLEQMLGTSGENGKSSGDENPFGNTLGGLNPLYHPLTTRRKKRHPPAESQSDGPDSPAASTESRQKSWQPVKAVHTVTPLRQENRPYKPLKPEKRLALDDCDMKTSPTNHFDTFNFKRSPMHQSINSKRPISGRQKQILEQLSALRQQLKSKQKEVEVSLLNGSRSGSCEMNTSTVSSTD